MRMTKRDLSSDVKIRDLRSLYEHYLIAARKIGGTMDNFLEYVPTEMIRYSGEVSRIVKINWEKEDPDGPFKYKYRLKIDGKNFVWYEWMFEQEDGDKFCPISKGSFLKDKQWMFDFAYGS